jgi:hypothetical protein
MANSIEHKTQSALQALLSASNLTFDPAVNTGQDDEAIALPLVACNTTGATAEDQYGGNWLVSAEVIVRENADDTTREEHVGHADEVFDILNTTLFAEELSAALDDYTCFYVHDRATSTTINGRSWQSSISLTLECCGSDIS